LKKALNGEEFLLIFPISYLPKVVKYLVANIFILVYDYYQVIIILTNKR